MIIDFDNKKGSIEISELDIPVIGLNIYENSIQGNTKLRDKLLDYFIKIVTKDFQDLNYDFTIKIQHHSHNYGRLLVPKLLIHTNVKSVEDMSRVFFILREYFMINGNLRLATEPYYQDGVDEEGYPVVNYFKRDEGNLTLLLDFTEYKCNEIYQKSAR